MSRQVVSSLNEEKQPHSPLWFNGSVEDSDPEDTNSRFDLLAAASTPLRVCSGKNSLFASPTKRLDNLRLSPRRTHTLRPAGTTANETEGPTVPKKASFVSSFAEADADISELPDTSDWLRLSSIREEECDLPDDDNDDNDDDGSSPGGIADQTIMEESSSDEEDCAPVFVQKRLPMYIRKRKHSESPMNVTPQPSGRHPLSQSSLSRDMSGVLTADSLNSTFSVLKLSFSASDSTPCPLQSRKRLKFKQHNHEETPSQPARIGKPILDISASRKLAASSMALLTKLNNASSRDPESDDPIESTETGSSMQSSKLEQHSTPISQSTPANSRSNLPDAYEESPKLNVKSFNFVRPVTQPNYETPLSRYTAVRTPKLQQLLNSYNTSDYGSAHQYKIIGDVPVSAAGMMDEMCEDVHIGDKRINDPYAGAPASSPSPQARFLSAALLESYTAAGDKLPLLEHFRRSLRNSEMNELITDGNSVWEFYKLILSRRLTDLHKMSFLKRERLRWHPDKWVSRLEDSCFEQSNIENLSKVINSFIEDINNGFRDI